MALDFRKTQVEYEVQEFTGLSIFYYSDIRVISKSLKLLMLTFNQRRTYYTLKLFFSLLLLLLFKKRKKTVTYLNNHALLEGHSVCLSKIIIILYMTLCKRITL